jgi:hypothetical protein
MESAAVFTVAWLLFVVCYLLSAISPVPLEWMDDIPYQVFPGCLGLLVSLRSSLALGSSCMHAHRRIASSRSSWWCSSSNLRASIGCCVGTDYLSLLCHVTIMAYIVRISVYKIIVSPVVGVDNFVDIYLASQLTSLVIFLQVRAS